jgi:hypothetical protein
MLQLGSAMRTIEGVTVFPDHEDPEQFWYLPAQVTIARRPSDDRPLFNLIKYVTEVQEDGSVGGGGFLMFTASLALDEDTERAIRSEVGGAGTKLTAVPFDDGTVECVALNLQGGGGTTAEVSADGTFVAVERVLGTTVPSLMGDNHAVFSLTLSKEGAIILEQAFSRGATPVGVIYDLKYTALQPAVDVKITADFKRVYDHFSANLSANVYYVEIGIEAGIEKLVQDGAIVIEVNDQTTDGTGRDHVTWAKKFFTDHLLSTWFEPTLTPGELQGGMADRIRAGGGALDQRRGGQQDGPGGQAGEGRDRPPTPTRDPPPPPPAPDRTRDGPTPPADGPTPPADGPTPPADGPTPPADGPTPPADGPTPPADGPTPPGNGGSPDPAPPEQPGGAGRGGQQGAVQDSELLLRVRDELDRAVSGRYEIVVEQLGSSGATLDQVVFSSDQILGGGDDVHRGRSSSHITVPVPRSYVNVRVTVRIRDANILTLGAGDRDTIIGWFDIASSARQGGTHRVVLPETLVAGRTARVNHDLDGSRTFNVRFVTRTDDVFVQDGQALADHIAGLPAPPSHRVVSVERMESVPPGQPTTILVRSATGEITVNQQMP